MVWTTTESKNHQVAVQAATIPIVQTMTTPRVAPVSSD
jgi:hypothetical protein